MGSPRITAWLAAVLMFCGVDIALGFFCGETFSSDLDDWGVVRVAAVLTICLAAAILGYRYARRTTPPASASWTIFTLASLLALVYAIELSAMWLEHFDSMGVGIGSLFLPYHHVEFAGDQITITSSVVNFAPDHWPSVNRKDLDDARLRLDPHPFWKQFTVTELPIWPPIIVLFIPGAWWLLKKLDRTYITSESIDVTSNALAEEFRGIPKYDRESARLAAGAPVTARSRRRGSLGLSLGGKLSIVHSALWLHWITVVFVHSEVRWSMRTFEMYLLSFPIGWVVTFVASSFGLNDTVVILFPALCANSFLCGYVAAWIYRQVLTLCESRAMRRYKAGLCINCGYSLRGNVSGTCPECGTGCAYKIANARSGNS